VGAVEICSLRLDQHKTCKHKKNRINLVGYVVFLTNRWRCYVDYVHQMIKGCSLM